MKQVECGPQVAKETCNVLANTIELKQLTDILTGVAAVTAIVLLGRCHPNEVSVDPEFIVRFWEGDSANWTAHSLADGSEVEKRGPVAAEEITQEGCGLVGAIMSRAGLDSAAFSILGGSSLERDIAVIGQLLPGINLHVLTTAGSRVYSQWRDSPLVKGCVQS